MTGRNEACPCGSGKKFKKCHGQANSARADPSRDLLIARVRNLLAQQQTEAALALLQTLQPDAAVCQLSVQILIGRRDSGDLDQALQWIAQWQELDASQAESWSRAVEIHLNRDDAEAARQALQGLVARSAGHAQTLYYQALVEHRFGSLELAIPLYLAAAKKMQPGFSEQALQIVALQRACATARGDYPGSGKRAEQFLSGQPMLLDALEQALESWEKSRPSGSGRSFEQEVQIVANAWYQLGTARMFTFDTSKQAILGFERSLHWSPSNPNARANALLARSYSADLTAQEIFEAHRSTGQWFEKNFPPRRRPFLNSQSADRPLRVAYLSSDIRRHPVAHFILPVLQQHDHQQVRPYVYFTSGSSDEFTRRAAQYAHEFVHAWDFDDRALANRIEKDQIDILVDLNGASAGGRLSLLATRVAPVQMTWLGYPNTTGLTAVDYRIVDEITDPAPASDALCTEKLLRLPRLFSVYDPLEDLPPITPSAAIESGKLVFGSFNNLAKINAAVIACWSELLKQLPESQLILKDYAFDMPAPRQRLLDEFALHGIAPARIGFLGLMVEKKQHMAAYSQIDIHLDSFPYNGTTTTCDSLVMGVPVVTLLGNDHRSRVGASLLNSLGHSEWVARDEQDYIRVAFDLAKHTDRLIELRSGLRQEMFASALIDAKTFTRELEQLYQSCWQGWCRASAASA